MRCFYYRTKPEKTIETNWLRAILYVNEIGDMFGNAAKTNTNIVHGNKMDINSSIQSTQFVNHTLTLIPNANLKVCPQMPPNLNGPISIDIESESIVSIEAKFHNVLQPGGCHTPCECNPEKRVAIVIPYRDRANHLSIFLKNIHALLIKQQTAYGIFVIEQTQNDLFNRAALMNVGFLEANKLSNWDCFIFHDIDLIPLDDRNLYRCPIQPRHMSVAIDNMGFK